MTIYGKLLYDLLEGLITKEEFDRKLDYLKNKQVPLFKEEEEEEEVKTK